MEYKAKLKDLTLKIGSGATPRGGQASYLKEGEIHLIRSQNVYNHQFEWNGIAYISEEQAEKLKNVIVEENDILINITGDSIARNLIANPEFLPARVNQHVSIIRCNPEKLDPYYLSAVLTSKDMQRRLLSLGQTGGTRAALTKKMLEDLEIQIFDIRKQHLIGRVLNMFTSKIDNNDKIITNLEHLAQTLFKRWFVDFEFPDENGDPYKSSGGEMVESELGSIPKGWKIGALSNLVSETLSGDWGKEKPEKNHQYRVNIIRGADIPELRNGRNGRVPVRYILEKNFLKKKLLLGDVVVEVSGGSPTQSTGRSVFIDNGLLNRFGDQVVSTNFCRVIRPVSVGAGFFIQGQLLYMYNLDMFFQLENGTTGIKNLDINNLFEKYKVILPPKSVIEKYYEFTNQFNTLLQELGEENRRHENLRDTLLPKLLSGEIELPDEIEVTDNVSVS